MVYKIPREVTGGYKQPLIFLIMNMNIIIFIKSIVAIILIAIVILAPAYLAQQTKQDKTNMTRIRIGSWLLGWTFIAWLWSLFKSTKK